MIKEKPLFKLYKQLYSEYGDSRNLWPQWCDENKTRKLRELVSLGAILTQRTSWNNADLALRNLKEGKLLSIDKIAELSDSPKLAELIKPAGFYQTKPKRLHEFSKFVVNEYRNIDKMGKDAALILREKLLSVYGIGPETADTIMLYALDKPSFIIDEYTKRFIEKHKISSNRKYIVLKRQFEESLPKSTKIYQNYHILMIVDQIGKEKSQMKKVQL